MFPEVPKSKPETNDTIEEDAKEGEAEDEEGLKTYPYERLTTTSTDPVPKGDIDVTRREVNGNYILQFVVWTLVFFFLSMQGVEVKPLSGPEREIRCSMNRPQGC